MTYEPIVDGDGNVVGGVYHESDGERDARIRRFAVRYGLTFTPGQMATLRTAS